MKIIKDLHVEGAHAEDGDITVIAWVQTHVDEAVVFVERKLPGVPTEYVSWRVNLYDNSCHSGHYTFDRAEGLRRFGERARLTA